MTLNCINTQKLLGFSSQYKLIIHKTSINSDIPINLITDTILNISISGDIELNSKNIHNYRSLIFEPSSIIYQKYITKTRHIN